MGGGKLERRGGIYREERGDYREWGFGGLKNIEVKEYRHLGKKKIREKGRYSGIEKEWDMRARLVVW